MTTRHTYSITLRWSAEKNAFLATVDELPGVEGSGTTHEEALASVQDAIRWYLESATEGTLSSPPQEKPPTSTPSKSPGTGKRAAPKSPKTRCPPQKPV